MRRIPALAFTLAGRKAPEVAEYLASQGLCAFADDGSTGVFASLGVGAILFTVIWHNAGAGLGPALGWTLAFGLLGIVLQAVSFVVLDLVTPGSLREIVVSPGLHPAGIAAAAAQIAISLIICASIA